MGKRIEQILEVIEEVREQFQNATRYQSVRDMRIGAVASVASRRGITRQTVLDTFIRHLKPDIKDAAHFDRVLERCLVEDSDELKKILLRDASDRKDKDDIELINNAFYKASESDILLAQEFGCDPNEKYFKEGRLKFGLHLTKERNPRLVTDAKALWNQKQNGRVVCSVCSFSFPETYGQVGVGFVEAHHIQPISSLTPYTIVSLDDIVPVCSNCHSMLHRHRPWLTVEQLRTIVSDQRKRSEESSRGC